METIIIYDWQNLADTYLYKYQIIFQFWAEAPCDYFLVVYFSEALLVSEYMNSSQRNRLLQ